VVNPRSTILIVDDDAEVIEALVRHFRKRNYEPIATVNPVVVMRELRTVQVDLLVLDLKMRVLDGFEVLDQIQKEGLKVETLIITGFLPEYEEKLKQYGISARDVISKPFGDFSKIEEAINRKLGKAVVPAEVGSEYEDAIYLENTCKVVVVDDETEVIEMMKEVLEERNYQVTVFESGDKALEHILKQECHVAVVDMKIPGLPGDQLIQKVLAAKPQVKVIPMSAAYEHEMKERLRNVGFNPDALLTKPFNLPMLIEQIKVLAMEVGALKKH
jgi:DNA-binding response OmpR family regulator